MAEIYADVEMRLAMLGYTVTEADRPRLQYTINRTERELKANINQREVPDGLYYVWVDMAAGSFLHELKAAGQLTGAAFDFSAPVKSIAEGDTTVSFAVGGSESALTPEAQFDNLLNGLINPPQDQFAAYRRVRW